MVVCVWRIRKGRSICRCRSRRQWWLRRPLFLQRQGQQSRPRAVKASDRQAGQARAVARPHAHAAGGNGARPVRWYRHDWRGVLRRGVLCGLDRARGRISGRHQTPHDGNLYGGSAVNLHLDYETRSEVDLKKCGLHVYAEHPSTEILCAAYALDDEPVRTWRKGQPIAELAQSINLADTITAHNAQFERSITNGA